MPLYEIGIYKSSQQIELYTHNTHTSFVVDPLTSIDLNMSEMAFHFIFMSQVAMQFRFQQQSTIKLPIDEQK